MENLKKIQEPSTQIILNTYRDPKEDIQNERKKATFVPEDMILYLYGKTLMEKKRKISKDLASNPDFNREDLCFLSGVDLYKKHFEMFLKIVKYAGENNYGPADILMIRERFGNALFPMDVHFSMFQNAVESQASEEQKDYWLPKIYGQEIIGTYAQTELGHGTYLRGLETTATFNQENDTFILHSPTPTSIKWWPGGLGKTSTHCVLYARLMIKGVDYGPHAFIVQLRDLNNHQLLNGVSTGDIGPKMGWHAIDNGYLKLNLVEIPRNQMLMKYAKVSREGVYEKPPHAKFNYTTMIMVRTGFIVSSFTNLAKAVTISIRYSCIRRQGGSDAGSPELQIIDYKAQQHGLFPLLALSYSLYFTGRYLREFYKKFANRTDTNDFSILPELHASSAGLKALTSDLVWHGIEICRQYCGGHGFHRFSGLPDLLVDFLPQVTGEGVNNVLYLQTSRYLLRQMEGFFNAQPLIPSLSYFSKAKSLDQERCKATTKEEISNLSILLEAFQYRAARIIYNSYIKVTELQKNGFSFEKAIEENAISLISAARAHCYLFILSNYVEALKAVNNPSLLIPLRQLCLLFALSTIEKDLGDWTIESYFSNLQCHWIHNLILECYSLIRPNAVTLVDSFDFSDFELNSSLGRYDGNCYEDMYRRAQKEPRNQTVEGPAYSQYIKPWLNKSFL